MSLNIRSASDFITKLLDSVSITHMHHFMVTGQGSYAKHMALGELYDEIQELTDGLAEEVMGTYNFGLHFVGDHSYKVSDSLLNDTQAIYNFIEAHRGALGPRSHIQNSVDGLCTALAHALYKLRRLQ